MRDPFQVFDKNLSKYILRFFKNSRDAAQAARVNKNWRALVTESRTDMLKEITAYNFTSEPKHYNQILHKIWKLIDYLEEDSNNEVTNFALFYLCKQTAKVGEFVVKTPVLKQKISKFYNPSVAYLTNKDLLTVPLWGLTVCENYYNLPDGLYEEGLYQQIFINFSSIYEQILLMSLCGKFSETLPFEKKYLQLYACVALSKAGQQLFPPNVEELTITNADGLQEKAAQLRFNIMNELHLYDYCGQAYQKEEFCERFEKISELYDQFRQVLQATKRLVESLLGIKIHDSISSFFEDKKIQKNELNGLTMFVLIYGSLLDNFDFGDNANEIISAIVNSPGVLNSKEFIDEDLLRQQGFDELLEKLEKNIPESASKAYKRFEDFFSPETESIQKEVLDSMHYSALKLF